MLTLRSEIVAIETLERLFGMAIAYLLPGAIVLFGLSYHVRGFQNWLGMVAEKDATFVGFLFVVAASGAIGIIAGLVRAVILEGIWGRCRPKQLNHAARLTKEAVYQNLVSQHYYYYQAYGNTAVALVAGSIAYLTGIQGSWVQYVSVLGAVAIADWMLVWGACDAIDRFETKRASLLSEPPTTQRDSLHAHRPE